MSNSNIETIDYTQLNIDRGLTAPLVRIPNNETIIGLRRALPMLDINAKHLTFINQCIALCQVNDEMVTSLKDVSKEMDVSISTIRNHAKALTNKGIFAELYCTTDPKNKRRGVLFNFIIPDLSIQLEKPLKEEVSRELPQMRIEEVDFIKQRDLSDLAFCDLITSVLFGALRFNQKGNQNKIESYVVWGSERVLVETQSGKGERIALLKDLRYYIATITVLESIIRERLRNDEEITETYNIPLNAILSVIQLPKTGGNKMQAVKSIRRLSGTSFHIKQLPKWFLKKYRMSDKTVFHLIILTLRVEAESTDVPGSLVLQIQFPSETISQIRRQIDGKTNAIHDLTNTHPLVLSITHNLVFAFSLWTSAYFTDKGSYMMDWNEMKDRTAPQFTMTNFKKAFSEVIEKHRVPAITVDVIDGKFVERIDEDYEPIYKNGVAIRDTANILGIKVVLDNGKFTITPEINPDSPRIRNLLSPFLSLQIQTKNNS
ncbi:hypothetical protein [Photorhabdus aegyptia]|uniref:Uncharacterized protein n=1 Tax=Photorhabdus aegyptia TaxID=2805098 RepID=A0A022PBU1_9GAMM|nr:hypothetical protein [Photorhabdus aegyptia]EYU13637.1 hypothetical protein BA1DRAFT_03882 [Photorhabdus aegyptia]